MYWETLPTWFWIIYYLCLLTSLGTAIFSVIRKKIIGLSIIAIFLTMTVPLISFLNSMGRAEGLNEFEHLVNHLQQGSVWSFYTILGYVYLLIWWVLLLNKSKNVAPLVRSEMNDRQ
ncbi:hypothetical protein ACOI1C_18940 [Bacillus sp. DJP31]|uniref:hypothetical protein n=1 Tax=Bacillus sp. DJP31 TaxID=3409789 RepID=UPI003BB53591